MLDGREVRIEGGPRGARIRPGDPELAGHVRRYLGGDFDLGAFYAFAATEPVLGPVIERLHGLRPPLVPEPFEALVTSITAQQVSLQSAFAIRNRLIEAFGVRLGHAYEFPRRGRIALAAPEELTSLGFSQRKAEYVVDLARSHLDLDALAALPDDEVKSRLVALRGIGEWTADWFLARHLARPRAWPAGDLALVKAVVHFYPEAGDVRAFGERFDPFQNLSAQYLLTGWMTR